MTLNPAEFENPNHAARGLSRALRCLVKRTRRKYKLTAFPYFVVFEKTKRGWPHLHVLTRVRWIDQAWLSAQLVDLINAPVVDIRRITDSRMMASYIAKYLGKQPHRFGTCKRYWSTRDWDLRPKFSEIPEGEVEPIFDVIWYGIETLKRSCVAAGDVITDTRDGFSILWEPPPCAA